MKVLKNSIIYLIAVAIQGLAIFFLIPIYTRYLTPEEYGVFAVVNSLISFFTIFYSFSLPNTVLRLYFDYRDEEKRKEFFGTVFILSLGISIFLTIALFFTGKILTPSLIPGISFYPYIVLALFSIAFSISYLIFQSIIQAQQKAKLYGIINIAYVLTNILLTTIFITIFQLKVVGILLALVVTNLIFFLYTISQIFPRMKFVLKKEIVTEVFMYAIPLISNSVFAWATLFINKLLLNNLKTTAAAGIYDIGFYFGSIIAVFPSAINQAYVPWFYEKMKDSPREKIQIIKFAHASVLLYGFIALGLSLFGKEILSVLVGRAFKEAWQVVPFITFSYVLSGIYNFFVIILLYSKNHVKYVPLATVLSAVTNIAFNVLLIPRYGIIGSAFATLIAHIVTNIVVTILSLRIENIAYNWKRMYFITGIFFIFSLMNFTSGLIEYKYLLTLKIILVILTSAVIYNHYKSDITNLRSSLYAVLNSKAKK